MDTFRHDMDASPGSHQRVTVGESSVLFSHQRGVLLFQSCRDRYMGTRSQLKIDSSHVASTFCQTSFA